MLVMLKIPSICNNLSSKRDNHLWRSNPFKYGCQIAQLVENLTRDSGSPGFNPSLVCYYFSHQVTFSAVPTLDPTSYFMLEKEPRVIFISKDDFRVKGDLWRSDLFKYRFQIAVEHLSRGPGLKSQSGRSLFLPSQYTISGLSRKIEVEGGN